MAIAKVTIEIDIACFDFGTAVFNKTGSLSRSGSQHREQASKAALGCKGKWGKHEKHNPKE
ncbi:hypothetical protein D3C75_1256420 [compost metagenome]